MFANRLRRISASIGTIAVVLAGTSALAAPYEINHACAAGSGCFDGDQPGYPIEITRAGSYLLTSRLVVPSNTGGMVVDADDVNIDLGGYSIRGSHQCWRSQNEPVSSCNGAGGHGIEAYEYSGVSVRNGTISHMGGTGLYLGANSYAAQLRLIENTEHGLRTSGEGGGTVIDCAASRNGLDGFSIRSRGGNTARGLTASLNGERGIFASDTTLTQSSAYDNGGIGIGLSGGLGSALIAANNRDSGIYATSATLVSDSRVTANANYGVVCQTTDTVLRDNIISGNDGDDTSPACRFIGEGFCDYSVGCP